MKKIDKTVLKETAFVGAGILILSVLMNAVFLILDRWDLKVLSGNLLSGTVALLNFFLMGITVQAAMNKVSKEMESFMRLSIVLRTALLFVVIVVGVVLPYFNLVTVFVPLFFPRIVITFRPLFMKKGAETPAVAGGCIPEENVEESDGEKTDASKVETAENSETKDGTRIETKNEGEGDNK